MLMRWRCVIKLFFASVKLIPVGGDVQVDDKTISRKHLTVEVEDVKPGACVRLSYPGKDRRLISNIGEC